MAPHQHAVFSTAKGYFGQVMVSVAATLIATAVWSAFPLPDRSASLDFPRPPMTSGGKFAARIDLPADFDEVATASPPLPAIPLLATEARLAPTLDAVGEAAGSVVRPPPPPSLSPAEVGTKSVRHLLLRSDIRHHTAAIQRVVVVPPPRADVLTANAAGDRPSTAGLAMTVSDEGVLARAGGLVRHTLAIGDSLWQSVSPVALLR